MNKLEKLLLVVISISALLVTVSQAYHLGYRSGYKAIECEANQE